MSDEQKASALSTAVQHTVNVEGTEHPWTKPTITLHDIVWLGKFPLDGRYNVVVEFEDGTELTIAADEEIELKSGLRFGRAYRYKRGQGPLEVLEQIRCYASFAGHLMCDEYEPSSHEPLDCSVCKAINNQLAYINELLEKGGITKGWRSRSAPAFENGDLLPRLLAFVAEVDQATTFMRAIWSDPASDYRPGELP